MRKGVILILLVLLSFNIISAYDLNVTNFTIRTSYAPGETISGEFKINLTNAPVNLYFSSDLGTLSLREFLKTNEKPLACENLNCSNTFSLQDNGSFSKTVYLNSNESKTYALSVTGGSISLNQLDLNFSSNFPESKTIPLEIIFGDNIVLGYNEFSDNYNLKNFSGCYDSLSSQNVENSFITSVGYCEKMDLPSSVDYLVGAQISGNGLRDFEFQIKDEAGLQILGKCDLKKDVSSTTTFTDNSSCKIQTGKLNPSGKYLVCIRDSSYNTGDASLLYSIKSESVGTNCGYINSASSLGISSSMDYSIYAKTPTYAEASANSIVYSLNSSSQVLSALNSYLSKNYGGNCINTCIIPISFRGISQNLIINSVDLYYQSSGVLKNNEKIFEIVNSTRLVNFSGSLFLEKFNWTLDTFGNKSFILNLVGLDTKKVLNATLTTQNLPIIDYITPLNPPAGVEVFFFLKVRNSGNSTNYKWDFGDGSPVVITTKPYTPHRYSNISNYNVTVMFGEVGFADSKTFLISSINPQEKLNETFLSKRIKLNHANTDLLSLPSWYKEAVSKIVNLDFYQSELNNLESTLLVAFSQEDFLEIAQRLYNLAVPWAIISTETKTGVLLGDSSLFNPTIIQEIFPSSTELDINLYKSPIFDWQLKNTELILTQSKIRVINENEAINDILSTYDISLTSNSLEESYLVIQEDFSELNFDSLGEITPKKIGGNTYITIPPQSKFSFKFYLNGSKEPVIFISPKLSLLSVSNVVGVCNFNVRCEKSLGETYKNCRSDCAPIGWTWFWLIFFLILSVVVYTGLQLWYKRKYEEYLFKDLKEMHNLLAFIINARTSSLSNQQIKEILTQKGWDRDQVDYALLRSEGKNPGMFEIIPVDKILLFIEKRKSTQLSNKKISPPVNLHPAKAGIQKPAFNPFGQQKKPVPNMGPVKTTTKFGQQTNTKY